MACDLLGQLLHVVGVEQDAILAQVGGDGCGVDIYGNAKVFNAGQRGPLEGHTPMKSIAGTAKLR
ncbi:hypothetical protein HaLaN_18645 [Haematococcus lacustris]|uniref:Uncharacterized protein n=1 Tax=Haematococcus lacustris TaxID=44745 RepID=A0A699ZRH0_HAELA|nr:hypothetical protein HaLaN_18645 [Haematococcus lacustris]